MFNINLDKKVGKVKLPLGWLLSKSSRETINQQNPSLDVCDKNVEYTFVNTFKQPDYGYFNDVGKHNSCVAKSIHYDLKQTDPSL